MNSVLREKLADFPAISTVPIWHLPATYDLHCFETCEPDGDLILKGEAARASDIGAPIGSDEVVDPDFPYR